MNKDETMNDAPNAAALDGVHRDAMLDYYWRKGIPSVVLAIVTVALAAYSYWFVQPNVEQRYRDICARNFLILEGNSSESHGSESRATLKQPWQDDTADGETSHDASERGSDERRRLLEQTQLCLRRLIIWDKSDDSVRFQSGQVASLLADWYLDRARSVSADRNDPDEIGKLVSRSRGERKKAVDAMKAVQKLDGKFAAKAYLWISRQRLQEDLELSVEELDGFTTQLADLVEKKDSIVEAVKGDAVSILAQALARQTLRVSSIDEVEKQIEDRQRVLQLLNTNENWDVEDTAWVAEALAITDRSSAQAMATKALQAFWGKGVNKASSVETLSAVFRCLLLVNSIKEGQVFLSERIQQVAAFEQPRFRSLTAAACLRQIVLNSFSNQAGISSVQDNQAVFSMSLQLNPESEQALVMLEMLSDPSKLEPRSFRMKELIGLSNESTRRADPVLDGGLRSLLKACVGLRESPISGAALADLAAATKATPVNGIVASRLAMRLVAANAIRAEEAEKWLKAINVALPELLIVWSDLAKLHLIKKEYAKAIECFEYLLGKLPGNEQLVEAIDAAKSQLNAEAGAVVP